MELFIKDMLKDKYTCPAMSGVEGEETKIMISDDTYALIAAKDEELIVLEKLRLAQYG